MFSVAIFLFYRFSETFLKDVTELCRPGHGGRRSGSGRKRIYSSAVVRNQTWKRGHGRIWSDSIIFSSWVAAKLENAAMDTDLKSKSTRGINMTKGGIRLVYVWAHCDGHIFAKYIEINCLDQRNLTSFQLTSLSIHNDCLQRSPPPVSWQSLCCPFSGASASARTRSVLSQKGSNSWNGKWPLRWSDLPNYENFQTQRKRPARNPVLNLLRPLFRLYDEIGTTDKCTPQAELMHVIIPTKKSHLSTKIHDCTYFKMADLFEF